MPVLAPERPPTPAPSSSSSHERPPAPPRSRSRTARALVVLLAVVGLFVAVDRVRDWLPGIPNPFATRTVDRSSPVVLKALEDLREYRAASGHFEVIVDVEKDARFLPSFVKGERALFVAVGSVDAGVDFATIGAGAVSVDDERRSVTVRLPKAQLSAPRLDTARSYVYDRDRGLLDRLGSAFSSNPGSDRELYRLAERRLAAAARGDSGLVERAERNTRTMLEGLLRSLGFSEVRVVFEAPPT